MSMENITRDLIGENIEKDEVVLMAWYNGTPMIYRMGKNKYGEMTKHIRNASKEMVKEKMDEGMTKEGVIGAMKEWMDEMLEKVLAEPGDLITNESLERAWGERWGEYMAWWAYNISGLLRLGAISQDDRNGWMLLTHNSCSQMGKESRMVCWEKDKKKAKKMAEKFVEEVKRRGKK